MSILYAVAGDLILKLIELPTLTLNGSEKPWMVVPSPAATSHWAGGEPGSAFSHATGLAQLAWADVSPGSTTISAPARTVTTATAATRHAWPWARGDEMGEGQRRPLPATPIVSPRP